ncbi:MAG TPA: GNAT family N-acetyltransferase [Bryobacteraceae bacterium]|nr:GNAT family N-acetyltransferase [Bryobacteraceae bacterium]
MTGGTPTQLQPSDIPRAMRLTHSAGWNQTEQDWARMLALAPDGCFAIDAAGTLVATTTVICYGSELAWIGMVLTLPEHRGQGLARTLMEHSLRYLETRGIAWVKLDATDMGKPLYEKLGFEDECAIERWQRPAGAVPPAPALAQGIDFELDGRAFGADRRDLLHRLASEEAPTSSTSGFALARRGTHAAYFGPCTCEPDEGAVKLVHSVLARHPDQPVFWDLLPSNTAAVEIATSWGFAPVRRLTRMVRKGREAAQAFQHDDSKIFAIAGFEYG